MEVADWVVSCCPSDDLDMAQHNYNIIKKNKKPGGIPALHPSNITPIGIATKYRLILLREDGIDTSALELAMKYEDVPIEERGDVSYKIMMWLLYLKSKRTKN